MKVKLLTGVVSPLFMFAFYSASGSSLAIMAISHLLTVVSGMPIEASLSPSNFLFMMC